MNLRLKGLLLALLATSATAFPTRIASFNEVATTGSPSTTTTTTGTTTTGTTTQGTEQPGGNTGSTTGTPTQGGNQQTGGNTGSTTNTGGQAGNGTTGGVLTAQLGPLEQDGGYLMRLDVGTPPQRFIVILDTASADLWLSSTDCPTCAGLLPYQSAASTSAQTSTNAFAITYNSGQIVNQAQAVADNMNFGGLPLQSQPFGQVTQLDQVFQGGAPFDGVLGMGFAPRSGQNAPPFLETAQKQGLIQEPVFALSLENLAVGGKDSTINLGGVDTSKFTGDITFVPVDNSKGEWGVKMDQFVIDNNPVAVNTTNAILDSSTPILLGPIEDVRKIFSAIPGAKEEGNGTFVVPCASSFSLALQFASKQFQINSADFTLDIQSIGGLGGNSTSSCLAAMAGENTDKWTLGVVFLKNFYTVWDMATPRFGLATKAT